ncbi:Potassium transporter [Lecanora helva]
MGCGGAREKFDNPDNEQKWDYINLSDFHSSSCFTPLSYGILYILLLISIAVYAVDLFTCINLLFFDKWSGQVKPAIPFETSRWIFTACIIISYILLAYRWWRAVRAMKTGVVAASYLDPLAVRVQSIRMGAKGRGWRRFLVFAALTKDRKGAEYVALFTYFSFEAWLRIVFAEGPRQVINALTLYSVMQADLVPTGQHAAHSGQSPIAQFFVNLSILASKNNEQAAILFGMLFTLVIWIFSALSLLMAIVFYITFLWHHIRDGSLSRYCRRKIDKRLHKIVMVRVNKALEKDNRARAKQTAKGIKVGGLHGDIKRQPTVPIMDPEAPSDIKPMSRQTTETDTIASISRPHSNSNPTTNLHREPTVPDVFANPQRPHLPSRSTTQSSAQSSVSYSDNAPLISSVAPIGYGPPGSNHASARNNTGFATPGHGRPNLRINGTGQGKQQPFGLSRQGSDPPPRQNIPFKGGFPPSQQPQARKPMPAAALRDAPGRPFGQPSINRSAQEYEMQSQPAGNGMNRPPPRDGGYVAFNPNNYGSAPPRNFTQPQRPPPIDYFGSYRGPPQRSGTAPITQTASHNDDVYEAYGGSWQEPVSTSVPPRPATTGPRNWREPRGHMPPRY